MAYLWFKSFHIIGFVVWFAGLFYLVRLFIYHAEAAALPEPAQGILKQQYGIMEKRLYHIITMPGMLVTIAMAIGILWTEPEVLKQGWLHAKLGFVAVLIGYHFYCGRLMKQLAENRCQWTGQTLRALNEAPTILLLLIVLLAIFKDSLPTDMATVAVIASVLLMMVTIYLYAKKRKRDQEKLQNPAPGELVSS